MSAADDNSGVKQRKTPPGTVEAIQKANKEKEVQMSAAEELGKKIEAEQYEKYRSVRDRLREARKELDLAVMEYEAKDFPTVHSKYDEHHACEKSKIIDKLVEASLKITDSIDFEQKEWVNELSS